MYDFKYRFYDPQICRFHSIDRLATSYPWYSPYQFAGNEVPNAIDLDGLEPAYPKPDGTYTTARDGQMQQLSPDPGAAEYFTNNAEGINPRYLETNSVEDFAIGVIGSVYELATGESPNGGEGSRVNAVIEIFPLLIRGEGKGPVGEGPVMKNTPKIEKTVETSNAARREVMRQENIPTSQQPTKQSKNASGKEYSYTVPKKGGGTETKSVQQQTKDANHGAHWEAGKVKTDGNGNVRNNTYGRPKLQNDKSKVYYGQ